MTKLPKPGIDGWVRETADFAMWLKSYQAAKIPTFCLIGDDPWRRVHAGKHAASHWLYAGEGDPCPGGAVCETHGKRMVDEYREKLGEVWGLVPLAEHYAANAVHGWKRREVGP